LSVVEHGLQVNEGHRAWFKDVPVETVDIHGATTRLSRLVERAARGEAFSIAKGGKPMVKVVPVDTAERPAPRRLGFLAGTFTIPDDFDALTRAEIEAGFSDMK
jgi:antitoxin (DNA-binding transcriptional repressor) of toxin-antitoxin stability system